MKFIYLLCLLALVGAGCGVKGKPLPPETPREMGIGKPQYKGVDEELKKTSQKDEEEE